MKAVFITGTDTEVGKTIVCGLLGRYLLEKGCNAVTQKWIQTGSDDYPIDIAAHLKIMGLKKSDYQNYLADIAPYVFKLPASPHLAAAVEKKKISAVKIRNSFKGLTKQFDFVIAEGIGGALVPFNKKRLVIDIADELDLPVIIVAQNKLGAINHTLLTIEAIKARGMNILGIIFNGQKQKADKIILDDNPQIIKSLSKEKILGYLPWQKNVDLLYNAFKPIGEKVKFLSIKKEF
jgi:dethiobiotin synthetase